MKIGVGVITYNRPKHLELWSKIWHEFIGPKIQYFIADDSKDRKGIAYRSNECLKALKDCDYIFLFNDDCFPIKDGWAEFFIEAHKASEQHHFLYLKETTSIKCLSKTGYGDGTGNKFINEYNNCGGCFMFLTKEVIEKVGGFCKDYGYYGFEHAGYSLRIHKAGLTPMGEFLCPEGAGEYIYAMDYDFHLPFNKQVNHSPSMPVRESLAEIEKNQKIFYKDIETVYQAL